MGSFPAMKFVKLSYKTSSSLLDFQSKIETQKENKKIKKVVKAKVVEINEVINVNTPTSMEVVSSSTSSTSNKHTYCVSPSSTCVLVYISSSRKPVQNSISQPIFAKKDGYLRNLDDCEGWEFDKELTRVETKR